MSMIVEITFIPIPWLLAVRCVQALCGVISLGLTGGTVSEYTSHGFSSGSVNFYLFVCCWTLFVALPYLVLSKMYFAGKSHYLVSPAMEALTMLFWFAGIIAVCAGANIVDTCQSTSCKTLTAAIVFGFVEMLLFSVTTGNAAYEAKVNRPPKEDAEAA